MDSGSLTKVDCKSIVIKTLDDTYAPVSVEYKSALVKSNVFFKVVDSFEYVSVACRKVRRTDVVFEVAVCRIFSAETVSDFFTSPCIFRVDAAGLCRQVGSHPRRSL